MTPFGCFELRALAECLAKTDEVLLVSPATTALVQHSGFGIPPVDILGFVPRLNDPAADIVRRVLRTLPACFRTLGRQVFFASLQHSRSTNDSEEWNCWK